MEYRTEALLDGSNRPLIFTQMTLQISVVCLVTSLFLWTCLSSLVRVLVRGSFWIEDSNTYCTLWSRIDSINHSVSMLSKKKSFLTCSFFHLITYISLHSKKQLDYCNSSSNMPTLFPSSAKVTSEKPCTDLSLSGLASALAQHCRSDGARAPPDVTQGPQNLSRSLTSVTSDTPQDAQPGLCRCPFTVSCSDWPLPGLPSSPPRSSFSHCLLCEVLLPLSSWQQTLPLLHFHRALHFSENKQLSPGSLIQLGVYFPKKKKNSCMKRLSFYL